MIQGTVLRKDVYFRETGYHPHPGQVPVHYDSTRHRALSNGRRWGKTLLAGKEVEPCAFVRNRLGNPQRGWLVGPEYSDCEKEFRVIYDTFKALGVDKVSTKFLKNVENGNMHIATSWGFDLQCRSARTPDGLVGEGLDFVIMCEAGRLHRYIFTEYIRPALSDKRGWSLMAGVPEIAAESSLLYWGFTKGQDKTGSKSWKSWRMPSWTNTHVFPGGRNDPEILEAEEDLTEDEFERQYGGKFVEKTGRVMKEWDDMVHLRTIKYNPEWPLYAAVDYGYTNWWVWLWIQVDNFDNVYIIGEHYIKEMDTVRVAQEVLKNHKWLPALKAFYPDPHNPDDTKILERELRVSSVGNTGGEITTRNAMIRQRLKPLPPDLPPEKQQAQITVDRQCSHLAWEMREGYRWPTKKREQIDDKNQTEVPLDKDNHGPEALSRFIYGYFNPADSKGTSRKSRQSAVKVKRKRRRR